jgi:hypothetical protein
MDKIKGDRMSDRYWTKTKPDNSGQLYLKDILKLPENTELVAHINPVFQQCIYYLNGNNFLKDIDNRAMQIQFIKAEILSVAHDDKYWHIHFRTLDGEELVIDLGIYGAVCWQGKYNKCRWLTLKEIT